MIACGSAEWPSRLLNGAHAEHILEEVDAPRGNGKRSFWPRGRPFVGNGMWVTSVEDPDGHRLEFESFTDVPEETVFSGQ